MLVINKLCDNQCYLVGGYVRQLLLQQSRPHDYDLVIKNNIKNLIPILNTLREWSTIDVKLDYGTVKGLWKNIEVDITHTRTDLKCFGRQALTEWANSLKQDSNRRELNINAIYYDPTNNQFVDFHLGIHHLLYAKKIYFIGSIKKRIREDQLRALRWLRFHAQLGFRLHPKEIRKVRAEYNPLYLSIERINKELNQIIFYSLQQRDLSYINALGNIYKQQVLLSLKNILFLIKRVNSKPLLHMLKYIILGPNSYKNTIVAKIQRLMFKHMPRFDHWWEYDRIHILQWHLSYNNNLTTMLVAWSILCTNNLRIWAWHRKYSRVNWLNYSMTRNMSVTQFKQMNKLRPRWKTRIKIP